MRTFIGIVLPISVFLFAGYLWSVQGRESMIVLRQRSDQADDRAPRTPLASAMPGFLAARDAENRNPSRSPSALDIEIPVDDTTGSLAATTESGKSSDDAARELPHPSPTSPNGLASDILPKPSSRKLWSRKFRSTVVRPHVLFVVIEDLNREDLGCYGQTLIRTPHIDRLALGGLRFSQFAGMSSGQTAQRTSILFGDLTLAHPVGSDRVIKLPQLSLPRMFSVSGYSTLLLGDCSWQLTDDPEQGHWLHYWGWQATAENAPAKTRGARPDGLVAFAPYPTQVTLDGACVSVDEDRVGSAEPFDQVLLEQARRLTLDCDPERPVAMMVSLQLSWWRQLQSISPPYETTDWTAAEKLHASSVTAADTLVGELVKLLESLEDRGPIATVVLGLPRERSAVELERFRAAAPAVSRLGGLAADQAVSLGTSTASMKPFGPQAVKGHWPLVPAIIAWPEHVRAGESEAGFTGYHDLLPTLATMIDARQMPLSRIMGTSHWKRWQVTD